MKIVAFVKYLPLFIGGLFLLGAIGSYLHSKSFLANATATTGLIVDLQELPQDDSIFADGVITFIDRDGQLVRFREYIHSSSREDRKGSTVPVLYLPDQSENARLDRFYVHWSVSIVLLSLAGVSLLASLLIMLLCRLLKRKQSDPPKKWPGSGGGDSVSKAKTRYFVPWQ
jgi:hypothetical protein